jgi:hypothetical protein
MIANCGCSKAHRYQDEKYGAGVRVFNETKKAKTAEQVTARCTVCGADKTFNKKEVSNANIA